MQSRLPTVVDSFYFDKGSMGFKVLLTLIKLFGVVDERLNYRNSQILPQLYKIGDYLRLNVEPVIQCLVLQAPSPKVLASINEVFAPFMKPFVEKIQAYNGILYDENIDLVLNGLTLNYSTGTIELRETRSRDVNVSRFLPIYETVLKDMGSDLGYTEEEVALLF